MPSKTTHVDQFLLIHSARADNWREITTLADAWAANRGERTALEAAIAEVAPAEEYHAYPGGRLLSALAERIATNDAGGAAKLARRISNGLLSHSYRGRPSEWDVHDEMSVTDVPDIMPPGTGKRAAAGHTSKFCSSTASRPCGGRRSQPRSAGYAGPRMASSTSLFWWDPLRMRSVRPH